MTIEASSCDCEFWYGRMNWISRSYFTFDASGQCCLGVGTRKFFFSSIAT